jgi:hypothetical protein
LLGYHREHLDVYPVEFIEAGPRPTLCNSCKKLLHYLVGYLVRAVEDNAKLSEAFREVFHTLSLSSAGRPRRSSAKVEAQCGGNGQPASLGEGSNDDSACCPKVLITIVY